MSIKIMFINFIVPIKTIKEKYLGGWEQCLLDHKELIGGRVYYDEHLFRDGAMNPMDMRNIIAKWGKLGFHIHDGDKWVDACVVEGIFGRPIFPCDWIGIDVDEDTVFLKREPRGDVVSYKNFATK